VSGAEKTESGMSRLVRQTAVIARRDFIATVATPTFLVFLLAPLFMIAFGTIGGFGASQMASSVIDRATIAALTPREDGERLRVIDGALRNGIRPDGKPPALRILPPAADPDAQARALLADKRTDVYAVLYGPLDRPVILRASDSTFAPAYLAELAEQVVRARQAGLAPDARVSQPTVISVQRAAPSQTGRAGTGFAAVFVIFFLTLLLAGQAVGTMAEEKSNKVIEILAAAVPLESVFLGKLIGMFGVALLFIAFWGTIAGFGAEHLPIGAKMAAAAPAIGYPLFILFCAAYFTMAYMLLGAVFLGVGAQASTVREIQMLSLPITIIQIGMFGLSSAAAAAPGTPLALFAQIFPLSSPFAMAGRGATDPTIWPHLLALAWQLCWVALTITFAARMFRRGVLKSGSGRLFRRRKPAAPSSEIAEPLPNA
jgi:ABC-2 type transport system permease protein